MTKRTKRRNNRSNLKPKLGPRPPITEGLIVLDQFSEADVQSWGKASKAIGAYLHGVFSALEAQRRTIYPEICNTLSAASNDPLALDGWIRVLDYHRSDDPLGVRGFRFNYGERFNYGHSLDRNHFLPFPALYIASNQETGMKERFGISKRDSSGLTAEDFAVIGQGSISIVRVNVKLQSVFDLRNHATLRTFTRLTGAFTLPSEIQSLASHAGVAPLSVIGTSNRMWKSLMDENWRVVPAQFGLPSNSQLFGKMLRDAGFEGVVYNSTKGSGDCLALFVENLLDGSYVELADAAPAVVRLTRLDRETVDRFI